MLEIVIISISEPIVSISLHQGEFCNESSSWLLGHADAQKNTGKLQWKQFFGFLVFGHHLSISQGPGMNLCPQTHRAKLHPSHRSTLSVQILSDIYKNPQIS